MDASSRSEQPLSTFSHGGNHLTRGELREELAVLFKDIQRLIDSQKKSNGPVLQSQVSLQGEFGDDGRPGDAAPPGLGLDYRPQAWVTRQLRSFAVGAELAETHAGLNEEEGRSSPGLSSHTLQEPYSKGKGPLAQAIRRAATMAGDTEKKKVTRFSTGISEAGSDVRSTISEVKVPKPGQQGQAWDPASRILRAGTRQSCGETAEVQPSSGAAVSSGLSVPQQPGGTARAASPKMSWASSSGSGPAVVEQKSIFSVLPEGKDIQVVQEMEEESEESDGEAPEPGVSPSRRNLFKGKQKAVKAITVFLESTTSLAEARTGPVPEARCLVPLACQRIVHHVWFEYLVLSFIIANAVSIGITTDYMARNVQETVPGFFRTLDVIFSFFFLAELVMRMISDGLWFWLGGARCWNILDFIIVTLTLLEEIMIVLKSETELPFAISLLRMLRFLRLVRVIRVMRLLRYITELRTIVTSLTSSMKPLLSSMLLMLLVVYIVGIYLVQLVLGHRLHLGCGVGEVADAMAAQSGPCSEVLTLVDHFGSVSTAALHLFQAVTGGVDWGDIVRPLMTEISPLMGVVFTFYIVFTALALMNIVTGVFVETSLAKSREDKDVYMINHLRDLFMCLDLNRNGIISWDELRQHLDNPKLKTFLKEIDLDVSEASGLFRLLDRDQSGLIDADEFLSGCINLRGPAKSLDMQLVMRELGEQRIMLMGMSSYLSRSRLVLNHAASSATITAAPAASANPGPAPAHISVMPPADKEGASDQARDTPAFGEPLSTVQPVVSMREMSLPGRPSQA